MVNPIHFRKGSENKVAAVFSCPGRIEERECCPAAGTTGRNLERLLAILRLNEKSKIKAVRKEITITNSWNKIEYLGKNGKRSEATTEEILDSANLERLAQEVANVEEYVLCFGDKAYLAICTLKAQGKLNSECKIIYTRHLSSRSINQVTHDMKGQEILAAPIARQQGDTRSIKAIENDNSVRRLAVIAKEIIDSHSDG